MCGPTRSAAFNVGGETCHQLFNIPARIKKYELEVDTDEKSWFRITGMCLVAALHVVEVVVLV